MYDPEFDFDRRLSAELGIANSQAFYPKLPCHEQELKFIVHPRHYKTIRETLQSNPKRTVDTRAWALNPYALVTFNLETPERDVARSGHSLRVRCALTENAITSIDMCIKTVNMAGNKTAAFNRTRGEWEIALADLKPDMPRMIAERSNDNPPLPALFRSELIRNNNLFVETIGVTQRVGYASYEKIHYKGRQIAAKFDHTEDPINLFLTPHADIITAQDSEAEAEFVGFHGLEEGDIKPEKFEKLMYKSMGLLSRDIRCAIPGLQENPLSKAVRAQRALETIYGPSVSGDTLSDHFNLDRRVDEAVRFSLSQRIKTTDVSLSNIWMHVGHLNAKMQRMEAPANDPFAHQKCA